MSSYFDRMSRCVDNPKEFVSLVRDQYQWYLHKCNQECLARDLERLNRLIFKFEAIKDKEMCQKNPAWEIQEMHTFAHELASADIWLRGGRRVTDTVLRRKHDYRAIRKASPNYYLPRTGQIPG